MNFNSLEFLIFLPIVVAVYWALPFRFRWIALLAASRVCVFAADGVRLFAGEAAGRAARGLFRYSCKFRGGYCNSNQRMV